METPEQGTERARRHTAVALVGSGLLILGGAVAAVTAGNEQFRTVEGLLTAGLLVTLPGYAAIHLTHRHRYGRLGTVSSLAAAIGQVLILAAGVEALIVGEDVAGGLGELLFFAGYVPLVLGVIGLAIAIYRADVLPRPSAFLLPVGLLLISVLGDPGAIGLGLAWTLLLSILFASVFRKDSARPEAA